MWHFDETGTHLELYVRSGCAYSAAVLHKVDELSLKPKIRNIGEIGALQDLIDIGGKIRVPFLHDHDKGVKLYESAEINDYLEREFGSRSKRHGVAR